MDKPLKVFITYSHENATKKDKLITRLALLKQEGIIDIWHDNEILPGDRWRDAIFSNLADSDLLLYLVSADSLNSENCNKELTAALNTTIRVIPIILEDCDWLNHQLRDFQALPDKGKPLNEWQPESKGWQNVVGGIRKVVSKICSAPPPSLLSSSAVVDQVLQLGNFLTRLRENDKAIEAYSIVIGLNSRNADAYCNRGVAYFNEGEVDRAIEDFNEAIKLDPNDALIYSNRGAAYGAKGEPDLAIKDFNRAVKLDPRYAVAYYNRGNAHREKSAFATAIRDCTKAIELRPDSAEAYWYRGNVYSDKEELDTAIKDYTQAIELRPNYTEAYYNRGNAYNRKGELKVAVKDYTEAVRINPDYAEAYANRGMVYGKKGELGLAFADLNKAIRLNSQLAQAYNNRGNVYCLKGEFDIAIKDFNTAIRRNSNYAEAYCNRGNAYLFKGDLGTAIRDYTQAIQIKEHYADAYNNRGVVYSRKGQDAFAIEDYNRAVEHKPDYADAYYNRGEAWLRLQEWEAAKTDLTTAKRKGMDIIAAFHNAYKDVETYEKRHLVKLPEGLAHLLTQRRRSRYPKTEKVLDTNGNPLESPQVVNLRERLRDTGKPLRKYLKTKPAFGINVAPADAFVVDKATRAELIAAHPSSAGILKPFLYGQDLRRWHVGVPHQWLIFAHRRIDIKRYPAILKHLEKHQKSLRKRKGKQKWYELPVSLDDTERFVQPKLVCPDTYNHQTFAVDTTGCYYGKTSYIIPTEETWLCGFLNSRTVEWFYSQVSNQLTIDPLRARSGHIQQIPIPYITPIHKALIAKVVDYLIYLQQQPEINSKDLKYARDRIMLGYFERVIDGLIYEAYLPEELHKSDKVFLQPLLDERLPLIEDIQGDKMSAIRGIFEILYDRMHLVRRHLYYLDSIKPVRIIQGKL